MIDALERSGWLNAIKIFGGLTVSLAVLIPAVLYALAGV